MEVLKQLFKGEVLHINSTVYVHVPVFKARSSSQAIGGKVLILVPGYFPFCPGTMPVRDQGASPLLSEISDKGAEDLLMLLHIPSIKEGLKSCVHLTPFYQSKSLKRFECLLGLVGGFCLLPFI